MIASVYIKDGHIHFYNEEGSFSNLGGLVYELGRPLLDFVCCEPERFDNVFTGISSIFDDDFAYVAAKDSDFLELLKQEMSEFQKREVYIFFYEQMLMEFVFAFIASPKSAVEQLEVKLPGALDKLGWALDFEWPRSKSPYVEVVYAKDKERQLYRAALDTVALMVENLKVAQEATIYEIELLLALREKMNAPVTSSMEYLFMLEMVHERDSGAFFFLEKPFRTFYGITKPPEIVELYEVDTIKDLLRFEFVKMIEQDIFIKKCKNCERFFIPKRRADAEYCDRIYGDSQRRCSEIGATLRYERKVAGNPILEAYSKAYKRFNSRTRAKKMTQVEFLAWSEQARKLRDECMAGTLSFDEFAEWLEQGRIRKKRGDGKK